VTSVEGTQQTLSKSVAIFSNFTNLQAGHMAKLLCEVPQLLSFNDLDRNFSGSLLIFTIFTCCD
jgi:hypothetical protein